MNKVIRNALAKGKVLREALDKKAAEEAKKLEEERQAKAAKVESALQADAEGYLSYVPEYLAKAVAERKPTFCLIRFNSEYNDKFYALSKLIEPELKKMGLQYKHDTSTGWVQLSYDPDTGYRATYNELHIIVPEEGL